MSTQRNRFELNLEDLDGVVGGASPIQVVMKAYNDTLRDLAAADKAATMDFVRTYGPLGSTPHF